MIYLWYTKQKPREFKKKRLKKFKKVVDKLYTNIYTYGIPKIHDENAEGGRHHFSRQL